MTGAGFPPARADLEGVQPCKAPAETHARGHARRTGAQTCLVRHGHVLLPARQQSNLVSRAALSVEQRLNKMDRERTSHASSQGKAGSRLRYAPPVAARLVSLRHRYCLRPSRQYTASQTGPRDNSAFQSWGRARASTLPSSVGEGACQYVGGGGVPVRGHCPSMPRIQRGHEKQRIADEGRLSRAALGGYAGR